MRTKDLEQTVLCCKIFVSPNDIRPSGMRPILNLLEDF